MQDNRLPAMGKKPPRKKKRRRILWGRVFALVIVLAFLLWGIYEGISMLLSTAYSANAAERTNTAVVYDSTKTIPLQQDSAEIPLYILLLGTDGTENKQTNMIMLLSVNTMKQTVDFISLPDNTKIMDRDGKTFRRLSDFYVEGGASLTKSIVEDIFHVKIPYYIVMSPEAFHSIMERTGNIQMYVESDMKHNNEQGETDIDFRQGYQTLTPEQSWGYVRYLDEDGSLSRVQRQQRFIKLWEEDYKNNLFIVNMYRIFRTWNYLETNISRGDAVSLLYDLKDIPPEQLRFYIVPGDLEKEGAVSYWDIDPTEAQKIIGVSMEPTQPEISMIKTN